MSVFWRLTFAYYVAAIIFYNRPFFSWRHRQPVLATFIQGFSFCILGGLLCRSLLRMDWPLLELWNIPGWICLLLLGVFYGLVNNLLVERVGQQKNRTLTFLLHDTSCILAIFLCSPLYLVYQNGHVFSEPWMVFFVGLLIVTKMFSVFIYMVELDIYGREYPTIDESFITWLMRLVFYLIALLPGWRWVMWFVVWLWACEMANKNRLMDFSRFALYFSAFGSTAVGLIVKWGFYVCR